MPGGGDRRSGAERGARQFSAAMGAARIRSLLAITAVVLLAAVALLTLLRSGDRSHLLSRYGDDGVRRRIGLGISAGAAAYFIARENLPGEIFRTPTMKADFSAGALDRSGAIISTRVTRFSDWPAYSGIRNCCAAVAGFRLVAAGSESLQHQYSDPASGPSGRIAVCPADNFFCTSKLWKPVYLGRSFGGLRAPLAANRRVATTVSGELRYCSCCRRGRRVENRAAAFHAWAMPPQYWPRDPHSKR